MTKKIKNEKCLFVITKNFNWQILTKNFLLLKDGVKDEKF